MLRYAITDRTLFAGNEEQQQDALVVAARQWATDRINFVQIREKDLAAGPLAILCRRILAQVRAAGSETKVLLNARADIAAAVGANGVHLTSSPSELTPEQVRAVYAEAGLPEPLVSVSCHTLDDILRVIEQRPDAILFGPVYEKVAGGAVVVSGAGIGALRAACEAAGPVPVYALGGVTLANAQDCLTAGAAGVAAIRLFQDLQQSPDRV